MLGFNLNRVILAIGRGILLFAGYLEIAIVYPTHINIRKGFPCLVLSQKTVPLIQFISRFPETRIEVEVTCRTST